MRSLKTRILGLMVVAVVLTAVGSLAVLWQAESRRVLAEQRDVLTRTLTLGQVALANELLAGDFSEVRNYLATLTLDPAVRFAALVDDRDEVRIDVARREEGRELAAVVPRAAAAAARARLDGAGVIEQLGGRRLLAVFPVGLGTRPGELRADRVGLLVLEADYERAFRAGIDRVVLQTAIILLVALVIGTLVYLVLDRSVSRPLARVLAVADAVQGGNASARIGAVDGAEFGQIAAAFNATLDRVQAQTAAIAQSAYRLRRTNQLARVMNLEWDLASGVVQVAPEFARQLGLAGATLDGTALRELVHEADRARFAARWQSCREEGLPFDDEFRLVDAHGVITWFQVRGDIEYEADGRPVRLLALALDISARRRAEEQQKALAAQLRVAQKMEAVGLLAGGIAHDFNNILAAILGFANLARRRFARAADPDLGRYLDEIDVAAGRGRDLIRQVLTFSQGEAGALAPLSLHSIVGEVGRLLQPLLPFGVVLDVRVDGTVPAVMGDPVLVQQIVMNLCVNARDAVHDGGHIVVSVALREGVSEVCASCREPFAGRYVVLEVGDDGPGIPAPVLERVFDPFFTTKNDARGRGGTVSGSGLGLAVVHGSVHQLGGHIVIRTWPDAGTLVAVFLPSRADEPVLPGRDAGAASGVA